MRLLVVGDPHVRAEDLDECEKLMELVSATAAEVRPDAVALLGDLFHTHALVHVGVVDFWVRWVGRLADDRVRVVALRGNHDGPHDPVPGVHALRVLAGIPHCRVVDGPWEWGGILWLPYYRDPRAFIAACRAGSASTVYCHQEFDGAEYEGGYYARDGVPPTVIPQKQVVSGHIHSGQEFGKVWYVGCPRWMTVADANEDRSVWVVEHADDGAVVSRRAISTAGVCSPIVRFDEVPGRVHAPSDVPPGARVFVDVRGPAAWVTERAAAWGSSARVRCTVTDRPPPKVRESDGIGPAARAYLAAYEPRFGADKADLRSLALSRLGEVLRE